MEVNSFALALFLLLTLFLLLQAEQEVDSKTFLSLYNERVLIKARDKWKAYWNYATNITDKTLATRIQAELQLIDYQKKSYKDAGRFDTKTRLQVFDIPDSYRTLTSELKQRELVSILGQMDNIYNRARLNHPLLGKGLSLFHDLIGLMAESRNTSVLLAAWQGWRAVTGPKLRPLYSRFVKLSNEAAIENNWRDTGGWWRSLYGTTQDELERLWLDLKPFYMELHAYVRYKLQQQYPLLMDDEPIPGHLMGSMWAQSWIHIYPLVEPYPQVFNPDLTNQLKNDGFNARKIVQFTEEFFKSIGFGSLPASFYKKSLLEKPKDRQVDCRPSAWNFYTNNKQNEPDVRIKQCTKVNYENLITTFHEMGRIYYFLENWNKTYSSRQRANPSLQEAFGDAVFLSVKSFGLKHFIARQTREKSQEAEINVLLMSALEKVASLPFWYTADQWRWNVFSGDIKESNYNKKWWEVRERYQGVKAPSSRDETDFDPAGIGYIAANTPCMRYFLGTVLQFNIHKAMCNAAGHTGPLHLCSVHESLKAGNALRTRMSTESPLLSNDATNTRSLKQYYSPLRDWLLKQRCDHKYNIGWGGYSGPDYNPCDPPLFVPPTDSPTTQAIQSKACKKHSIYWFIYLSIVFIYIYH